MTINEVTVWVGNFILLVILCNSALYQLLTREHLSVLFRALQALRKLHV